MIANSTVPTFRADPAPGRVSRRTLLRSTLVAGAVVATARPGAAFAAPPAGGMPRQHGPEVLQAWYRTLYDALMDDAGATPGRAARVYATTAVAAHEAVATGTRDVRSLAGQLRELGPAPRRPNAALDWPSVVSEAIASAAADLLRDRPEAVRAAITRAAADHREARRVAGVPARVATRSIRHGTAVGQHVAAWARADGAETTFTRAYTPPVGPDLWRSTPPNYGTAIDPYWGTVRTMALPTADACHPVAPIPFSTDPSSAFHGQAMAVLEAADTLTDAGRATSLYWRDNPTTSGLPSGHWMLLVAQVVGERGMDLPTATATLAATGIALHDAFVSCWHEKYAINLLRPISYINLHVPGRAEWRSYVNTPQFPEYTSGHSVASQAAATVLTGLLGTVVFTDRTHAVRNPSLGARSFASFQDAAYEAANSRLLGGIHYPMGIDVGLQQGEHVGRTVLQRVRLSSR